MSMTNLEAEIAKAKKQAADRIKKLKREAAAEQNRIDAKVVELLQVQHPDLYSQLAAQASDALAADRAKRSGNARRSASAAEKLSVPAGSGVTVDATWREAR